MLIFSDSNLWKERAKARRERFVLVRGNKTCSKVGDLVLKTHYACGKRMLIRAHLCPEGADNPLIFQSIPPFHRRVADLFYYTTIHFVQTMWKDACECLIFFSRCNNIGASVSGTYTNKRRFRSLYKFLTRKPGKGYGWQRSPTAPSGVPPPPVYGMDFSGNPLTGCGMERVGNPWHTGCGMECMENL